ncbi:MAG: ABC transporter substrate-binding protein [Cyanobacteriota bacterium]
MQGLEEIKETGILKVGIAVQEGIKGAPWAWKDDQTKLVLGFESDIARAIAKELNVEAEFIPLNAYRLIIGLINDSCHISIGALKDRNEMSGIIFSAPYYNLTQKIVSQEDSTIYDLVDLKGYEVGVLKKSLGEFIIQQENNNLTTPIKIVAFEDVLDLFSALQFKDIVSVFIDSPVALWYAKTYIDKKLKVSEVAYRSGSYSIALKDSNTTLKDRINMALKNISLRDILDKYGLWDEAQDNN